MFLIFIYRKFYIQINDGVFFAFDISPLLIYANGMLTLETFLSQLAGVNRLYVARFEKLGLKTIEDLIYHIPFRYEDFSQITKINLLQEDEVVTIVGIIEKFENIYTKYGKKIQKTVVADDTGRIDIVWYNQPYLYNILRPDTRVTIAGKVSRFGKKLCFQSPEYEIIRGEKLIHSGRLVPIYPETRGLSSKYLRVRISSIFDTVLPEINDPLPRELRERYKLCNEQDALRFLHSPKTAADPQVGKRKLAFTELLEIQLAGLLRKTEWEKLSVRSRFEIASYKHKISEFISSFPFELTGAQKRAVSEIMIDLSKTVPMNRLLEGDVGSGKTVVAAVAIYIAFLNGQKSAFIAPTEILANQHFETMKRLLTPFGVKSVLVTATAKPKTKESAHIYIGTHALLTEKFTMDNLGLIVIDEQQRFGVEQRARLRKKGNNPHVLSMTATPIPRTVVLTLHANLSLSILDEMPKGRQKVKTWVVPPHKRQAAYEWIIKQITESGRKKQVFIICPFIEESESILSVKSAIAEFERLKKDIFPDLNLALIHGRLKTGKKNEVLTDFKSGKYDILVSTPVVEVGIDIPGAAIILIEAADRFGLSQLHQLRGRVGRGTFASYCLLFTESDNEQTINKLKKLETIYFGPDLAELDLKLRGGGEIYGTRQHGRFLLKYGNIFDQTLLKETKEAAHILLKTDPTMQKFHLLRKRLQKYTILDIAPD